MSDINGDRWQHLAQAKITARESLKNLPLEQAKEQSDPLGFRFGLWQPDNICHLETNFEPSFKPVSNKKTFIELRNIFLKLKELDLDIVLVGGQAVNYWANYYQRRCPQLNQYIPYSSEDIDFFGGRLEAQIAHQALGGEINIAKDFSPSPNSGVLLVPYQNSSLRIDFLASVYGLSDADIIKYAVPIVGIELMLGADFKVISPLLCLEGKLKSLMGLPQQGRQDLKHLQMSILIAREFIAEIVQDGSVRLGLNLIERLARNSISDAGLQAWYQHGIDTIDAIPLNIIEETKDSKLRKFIEVRYPQMVTEVQEKRKRYQALMERFNK